MKKTISDGLKKILKNDTEELKSFFQDKGYQFQEIPEDLAGLNHEGEACALAYPIQGILKYHGFYGDPDNRIAYFPSISFNNGCACSITYVKLDAQFNQDRVILNGKEIHDSKIQRVRKALDVIRGYSEVQNRALVISRNIYISNGEVIEGKGLGTSASASAALALAAMSVIYDNEPRFLENQRLISFFSRFLSGSGCRSATGGISLWMSHPQIAPFDCFSFRLDTKKHKNFMNRISLLTIPLKSDLETVSAHEIAPKSLFFDSWLKHRKSQIIELFNGLETSNLDTLGQLAEFDTHCLHSVTMTGQMNENILAWHPKTLRIMHSIRKMRKEGVSVYYSIDTGPSVIILLPREQKEIVINRLSSFIDPSEILESGIGGKAKVLKPNSPKFDILKGDINKFK